MKFKIGNRNWTIRETNQEELQKEMGEINGCYFGLTIPNRQEILLWEDLCDEQKRQTLCHELFHCYTCTYISFNALELNEDWWADICANSHDIIHEITEKYFTKEK